MGKYGSLALLLFLMVLLSRIFAVSQQMRLNKDLTKLKKRGPVSSVGLAKSTLGGARIAVFIAEKSGEILEAYYVGGRSVLAGYKLDENFPYKSCWEAKEALEQKKKLKLQEQAYLSAAKFLCDGLTEREELD